MTYMCNKCFEIYNLDTSRECKNCSHGELIQVDELLVTTIKTLNIKGYTTLSCCSGHCSDRVARCYIKFAPNINIEFLFPDMYEYGNNNIIQRWFKCENEIDLASSILNNAIFLLKWANKLPTHNLSDMATAV